MINSKRVLGIVLARAGSKGLPGKNWKPLMDKPLVQYAIEAGINSKYIDDVIISTDCEQCLKIARNLGIEVPFRRPNELSSDGVSSADVIAHAFDFLNGNGRFYDMFVLLEPTSPLRDGVDVDKALEIMINGGHESLVSVCQAEDQHPSFMFNIKADGTLVSWSGDKFIPLRRQEIQATYYLDGSVYASNTDIFLEKRTFCHAKTGAYMIPKWKALEIDDLWDFICIEAIMKYRQENAEVGLE